MASKSSSSDVSAPNYSSEPLSDHDLIRGFTSALGAGGRKGKNLHISGIPAAVTEEILGVDVLPRCDWP